MMLATWLVEIYLSKCNNLEDIIAAEAATSDVGSLRVELKMMEDDLRNFMTRYQVRLGQLEPAPATVLTSTPFSPTSTARSCTS
jgi:hypothetical protein